MAELKIKVDRVLYPAEGVAGDWYIIATDKGVIKGDLSWRPEPNELLIIEGTYGAYQGKPEFKFNSARADVPVNARDQLRYVCETTHGFGMAMETKIWDAWGDDWKEKAEPGIIKTLKGRKFESLTNAIDNLELKREESECVSWLMAAGSTVNMAQAAWTLWQKQTVGIVKSDCYRLAELPNFGFANVDRSIRINFNIGDTDPRRIKAGVKYAIKQMTDSGSTLVNWYLLKDNIFRVLGNLDLKIVNQCVRSMLEAGQLIGFVDTKELATAKDHENANIIWEYVTK